MTRRTSVLITCVQHYRDRPSGSARIAFDEAKYLASAGCKVAVLAPAIRDGDSPREEADGVMLLRYRVPQLSILDPRRGFTHYFAAIETLESYLDSTPDIVHGHIPLSYIAALSLFGKRSRTCYTAHSAVRHEMALLWGGTGLVQSTRRGLGLPVLNRIERRCLLGAEVITALSEYTRGLLGSNHGHSIAERVQVFPGWVDSDRFQIISDRREAKRQLNWPTHIPVFFTLRRLVPRMGLDRLLCAARELRTAGKQFHLVIGGSGPLRTELEQLTRELALSDCVTFIGYVSETELPNMYGACDAFVLPTAALECFGLIALEAFSCGRPVLATGVGAIPEVVGMFEPNWITRSPKSQDIAFTLNAFLSGTLPVHEPDYLRGLVQRQFSKEVALHRFASAVVGPSTLQ